MGIFNETSGYYNEDSCLYSMQINQSDLGIASLWYPARGKNLEIHPFYRSDIVRMISPYRVLTQTYDSDLMGVFAYVFTPGVWMTVVLSCFVFWFITKMHLCMRNRLNSSKRIRDDSLYEVLTHLFQVETIDYKGACMKVVSLFASVLSFVVIAYFTCSMKTDIVVVQEPDMINSYDDLLTKPNIRLTFSTLGDTFSRFESADPQSKERRAFERSLKTVGGDKDKMIMKSEGIGQLIGFIKGALFDSNMRTVSCLFKNHVKVALNLLCYLKVMMSRSPDASTEQSLNFYAWASQDPDAKENLLTSAYSAFYKSPYLEKVHKRVKRIYAMGFENMWERLADLSPAKVLSREEGDIYRSCKADDYHRNLPQVECAPFALVQFKALTITCGVLLVLSVVAFAREKCKKKPKHPRFGHKVAVAASSGVADREGQSEQSGRNDAPWGRVVTAIEVVEREAQDTLNVHSRVQVATSMELFNERSGLKQEYGVELPLSTIAGPSATVHRSNQSIQSSWTNAEIELFDQRRTQSIPNVQLRVRPFSTKFSRRKGARKGTCEVELVRRTSADRRGLFGRRDRSSRVRSSRKVTSFQHNTVNETEFLEQRSQGLSSWQSRFRAPSMDFSNTKRSFREDLQAQMRSQIRSRGQRSKWKIILM